MITIVAEEFAEILRRYDDKKLELDESAKQLRSVLVELLKSEDITGRQRSKIRVAFLALDENLDNFEETTRRKRAGVPGADENFSKASYELKSSIESIRDLMMEYIKKEKSVVTPSIEPQFIAQPKVEAEDQTENQYVERIMSDPEDDTAYNALGNYYFSKGRYEDAIKQYVMAASKKELSVYYSNAGDAYRRLRKWSESIQFYQKALATAPNDDIVNNYLGIVYFEQGKYEEAKRYYLEAIGKNPEPVYFVNMGLALVMQNKLDEGIQYYENALMIHSENASAHAELAWAKLSKYYAEGSKEKMLLEEALSHYKESLRIDPKQLGYFHYCGLGEVYSQNRDWDKAIEYYEKSVELGPNSRAFNGIGNVYFAKGEYPKAREYYRKALEKNPNYYIYAENIGRCHKQLKEWDQAVIYFKKALELNPRDSVTLSGLGEMLYQMGQIDEATKYFGEAIKIDPNNFLHQYWMGMVSSAQTQWDAAIPYFRKAIELNPQDDYSYYALGFVYFGKGLLREATELLLKAISIRSTDPLYYARLSLVYSRSRMWDDAIKYAVLADEKAKAINPNDDGYKVSLARVYNDKGLYLYNSGRLAESVAEYKQALNVKEEDVYHWNLYLAYRKMNDLKEAKKSLARAIQLKPDERMYLEEMEKV